MRTLKDQWEEYIATIFPDNPLDPFCSRYADMERCFYVGALVMMQSLDDLPSDAIDAGRIHMSYQSELIAFVARLEEQML